MSEFSFTIESKHLSRGLRPSKRMPRNSRFLVECKGTVGRDGTLQSLDEITRLATTAITDAFPYPQIFVFTNVIIICSSTKIYEWISDALVEKLEVAAGSTWCAIDFFEYVYLSNGTVAVVRNALDKTYSTTSELPTSMAAVNFNGQTILGSPDSGVEL